MEDKKRPNGCTRAGRCADEPAVGVDEGLAAAVANCEKKERKKRMKWNPGNSRIRALKREEGKTEEECIGCTRMGQHLEENEEENGW